MTTIPGAAPTDPRLDQARQVLRTEAAALQAIADRLGSSFLAAVDAIYRCTGRVCLTGTGKSADVAQKIAGTFNSTGTRAYLLDATRAVHGDLGMVAPDDVVLALSHSGESEEVVRILRPLRQLASLLIGLTSNPTGTLAREADIAIVLGPLTEADPLGLAPSTSTTAMIAVGDALAFVLSRQRAFNHEDFARYHPAGSLGRKLMKVEAIMRRGSDLRIASAAKTVREVFAQSVGHLRRSGAVMLVDDQGKLVGLFTDSDLARLFEQRRDHLLDEPISRVMTQRPLTIRAGSRLLDALDILRSRKISELPVVDDEHRPIGLIDITDVLGLMPEAAADAGPCRAAA
ncbi:MAG: KpsF/GutQ family sugar-phosphate isomerase [Gemmatales bacterium]|nr:KpsF/GutQ family sugar-phosphate isomerase [Gemmatales bacterium]MDW8388103.1 KpsF/GutQ family sugar-phosphate isomerase [Gemmatales bacterium]